MAIPAVTVTDVAGDNSTLLLSAALTSADNTSAIVRCPEHYSKSLYTAGTLGGSTTVLEGSLDGATFYPLTNKAGTAIGLAALGMTECDGTCLFVRFRLSVVGAGAAIAASAMLRATASRAAQRA